MEVIFLFIFTIIIVFKLLRIHFKYVKIILSANALKKY